MQAYERERQLQVRTEGKGEGAPTLKPPACPSRLVSTVPGLAVLHMLHDILRAQLVFPHPGQTQSSAANMPACRPQHHA